MRKIKVAAIQLAVTSWDIPRNVHNAQGYVREAARQGAHVILLPELFEAPYFCTEQDARHFALARPLQGHPTIELFSALAKELGVVLPISFFEQAGKAFYNSLAMIDADGSVLGLYRKTHIPDGPGYSEKFYFTPGDTGFKVWNTRHGCIGVGICWDQWYPECARAMSLMGAELLLYPTAIGSEPQDPALDSANHWQQVMQGHAAANMVPVVAANRTGTEQGRDFAQTYYGSSFIADVTGTKRAALGRNETGMVVQEFDLDGARVQRESFGFFRDRRPDMYGALRTSDGFTPHVNT